MAIIEYIKSKFALIKRIAAVKKLYCHLSARMELIDETMDLNDMADVYARYVCEMNRWRTEANGMLSSEFCEISFSFMNGYVKALHDNGLKFEKGLVKKRDIADDMPSGALYYYRRDVMRDTNVQAIAALRKIMEYYESSKTNINTIVSAFSKELEIEIKSYEQERYH